MQILFVRNARSPVRQLTLSGKNLLLLLAGLLTVLMLLNLVATWLLSVLGFTAPPAAVNGAAETRYEQKLTELGAQLTELGMRVKRLDAVRQQMIDEAPPVPKLPNSPSPEKTVPSTAKTGGQGGPMIAVAAPMPESDSFQVRIDRLALGMQDLQLQTRQLSDRLYTLKYWQASAPTGYPLPYIVPVSSLPGMRMDPFTELPSWHAGTDYAAQAGMPILATGDGYVIRAEWDNDFGNVVEVLHPGVNTTTRYAHAEAHYVKVGQRVRRGEVIARVGSTGRSTAPHLHYEVRSSR